MRHAAHPWLKVASVAALLVLSNACSLIAPLEDLNRNPTVDSGVDAGVTAKPSGRCDDEARRCADSTPQVCKDGRWGSAGADCEFICAKGECGGVCRPEARECKDGAARVCDDQGQWQSEKCAGTCESGTCKETCEDGTRQCAADERLEECQQSKFIPVETCEAACVDTECVGECKPGALRCSSGESQQPERCDENGEWQSEPAACSGAAPVCVDGRCSACTPESLECIDGVPNECNPAGAWQPKKACNASETCYAGNCVACEPEATRCTGSVLEVCSEDGSEWKTLEQCQGETPACIPALQACGACLEDERECMGDTPQVCNDRGEWVEEAACSGETPACLGAGACVACDPNETPTRCLDDATSQSCSADGGWGAAMPCVEPLPSCRADTGRCGCTEEARRCTEVGPELCVAGMWVAQPACDGQTPFCLPNSGQCVACKPGEETCVSGSAQRCDVAGKFQALNACAGTTVNCGGCDLGESCASDVQCLSGNCVLNTCRVPEDCSNGLDDDGDGDPDCADSACLSVSCVDVPSGWLGPLVVATDEFTALPAECPTDFDQSVLTLNSGPTGSDVTCSACSCTDSLTCDDARIETYLSCTGSPPPTDTTAVADGQCVDVPVGGGIALVAGTESGTCEVALGGEVTATPPAAWRGTMKGCGQAATTAVGCGASQVCLPASLPADFESRYCVYRSGDETCPSGYLNRRIFYSDFDDQRGCADCACTAQGDCESGAWQPFGQASCAADPQAPSDACAAGACQCSAPPPALASMRYSSSLSCDASGGEPSGTVEGDVATAVTVCCTN